MRMLKNSLIVFLTFLVAGLSFYIYSDLNTEHEQVISTSVLEQRLVALQDLTTIRYDYTNVTSYTDGITFRGFTLPFTEKKFLIKYTGYLKGGIDLSNSSIDIKDNKATIVLEEARITDNVINEEDVYIYDQQSAVFNMLTFEDLFAVLPAEKMIMEKEVIEKGFLERANENAAILIKTVIQDLGIDEVEIQFTKDNSFKDKNSSIAEANNN